MEDFNHFDERKRWICLAEFSRIYMKDIVGDIFPNHSHKGHFDQSFMVHPKSKAVTESHCLVSSCQC